MSFEGKWKVTFGEKDALLRGCSEFADIIFSRKELTLDGESQIAYRIFISGTKNDKGDMIGLETKHVRRNYDPEINYHEYDYVEVVSIFDMMIQSNHVIARFTEDGKKLNIYYFGSNKKIFTFEKV